MTQVLSDVSSVTGLGGVVFSEGPYTDTAFATLLIAAYRANYQIRIPGFDPFMQENIPTIDSFQQNGTPEGTVLDVKTTETDGANFESDVNELVADHPTSTAAGLMVVPALNPFDVQLVPGVVNILGSLPESFMAEIYTEPLEEEIPGTTDIETVTSLAYQRTSAGWSLMNGQAFNDYTPVESKAGEDHTAQENED